jgi:hypothetical protein
MKTYSSTSALGGGVWSVSRPGRFYTQRKSPLYPLDRRLGGPQSRSGRGSEEKKSKSLPGIEFRSSCRSARSQSLYRLVDKEFAGVFNCATIKKIICFRELENDKIYPRFRWPLAYRDHIPNFSRSTDVLRLGF